MLKIGVTGFGWDNGNQEKCQNHSLSIEEVEGFFKQKGLFIAPDIKHSKEEERYLVVGRSPQGRPMLAVFTLREKHGTKLIRPISARYMHEKEARKYDEESTGFKK